MEPPHPKQLRLLNVGKIIIDVIVVAPVGGGTCSPESRCDVDIDMDGDGDTEMLSGEGSICGF
jgi:hypothetical protein